MAGKKKENLNEFLCLKCTIPVKQCNGTCSLEMIKKNCKPKKEDLEPTKTTMQFKEEN